MPKHNTNQRTLSQLAVLTFFEQHFLLSGELPTLKDFRKAYPTTTQAEWDSFVEDSEFNDALATRGLPLVLATKNPPVGVLTPEQLACANVLLDTNDRRSRPKKLADLGIPTQTYEGWLRNKTFSDYMHRRSEAALKDRLHDVHGGLLDRATTGDAASVKLYYEMTGRFKSSDSFGAVDLGTILIQILEILQKRISDPVVLTAISDDLLSLGEPSQKQIAS